MRSIKRGFLFALLIIGQGKILLAQSVVKNNQIKWSPVRMGDLVNPGVELGYERLYSGGDLSTQVAYGYMRDLFNTTPYQNYRGSRISLEQKYFHKRVRRVALYVAVEAVRLDVKYGQTSTFYQDTTAKSPWYYDDYNISKQTLAFNTKYGLQLYTPFKNLILDVNAGLGVMHRKVVWTDVDDRNAIISKSRHPNIYEISDKEANEWAVNIPITFKICYQF